MKRLALVIGLLWLAVGFRASPSRSGGAVRTPGDTVKQLNNTAIRLSWRGNHATANGLLERAGRGRPSDTIVYNQALVLSRLHRYEEAYERISAGASLPHARLNQGILRCRLGDWTTGAQTLESAEAAPTWADERAFNRAIAYYQLRDYVQANRAIDEAIRLRGQESAFRALKGDILLMLGKYREAQQTYAPLERHDAFRKAYPVRLGHALVGQQQYEKAVEQFEQYLALPDKDYHYAARYGLGNAWYGLREFGKALTEYRKATQLHPQSALAHTGLGNAYCSLHDYKSAQAAYQTALELDPGNKHAHLGLGVIANRQKQFDVSLAHFARAEELFDPKNPDLADSFLHRGLSLVETRQTVAAQTALKAAIGLRPNHPAAYAGLSELHRKGEHFATALDFLEKALAKAPDNDHMLANLGSLYLKLNRMDEAYPKFRIALQKNPRNVNAFNGLAVALLEKDRIDEARFILDSLITHGHHQAFLYNNRGIVRSYIALKQEKEKQLHPARQMYHRAQKDFEKAQALDSTRQFYQNNLGNVFKNIQQYENAIRSYQAYLSKTAINNMGVLFACNRRGDFSKHYLKIAVGLDSSNMAYQYNQYKVYQEYSRDSLRYLPALQRAAQLLPTNSISAKYSRDGYINIYLYDYDFDAYEYPADHFFPIRIEPPTAPDLLPVDDFVFMPDEKEKAAPPPPSKPFKREKMPKAPKSRHWGSTRCPTF